MRDGWVEISLSEIFRLKNQKLGSHQAEPSVFAISKYEGVILASDFFGKRIASKKLDGYKTLQCGDWVYSTIHIDEGSIAFNHFPYMGVVSPMYTTMTWSSDLNLPEYFELLLRSPDVITIYGQNAQGSINRRRSLSFQRFSQLNFIVPPLAEQKRIVDLISSVDSYIEALQQQVDKARKSRNAVLHELLTKGGKGWIETTLGELVSISTGKLDVNAEKEFGNYPFFTCANEVYRIDIAAFDGEFVIIAGNGDLNVKYYNGKFNAYQRTYVIGSLDKNALCNKFLYFFMQGYIDYLRSESRGTTIQYLKKGQFTEAKLSLPPLAEQKRIVEIISVFDNQIEALDSTIAKTKNLRSALLSDLLSGNHEIPRTYDKLIGAA